MPSQKELLAFIGVLVGLLVMVLFLKSRPEPRTPASPEKASEQLHTDTKPVSPTFPEFGWKQTSDDIIDLESGAGQIWPYRSAKRIKALILSPEPVVFGAVPFEESSTNDLLDSRDVK